MKGKKLKLIVLGLLSIALVINIAYGCWTFGCWSKAGDRCDWKCASRGIDWYCYSFYLLSDSCENRFCYQIFEIECRKDLGNGAYQSGWDMFPCAEFDPADCPPPPK